MIQIDPFSLRFPLSQKRSCYVTLKDTDFLWNCFVVLLLFSWPVLISTHKDKEETPVRTSNDLQWKKEKRYKWKRWVGVSQGWILTCLEEKARTIGCGLFLEEIFSFPCNALIFNLKWIHWIFSCKKWLNFWSICVLHCANLRADGPLLPSWVWRRKVRLCACLNRVKSLKSPQPKLLNWLILFYLVKLLFQLRASFYW